MNRNLFITGVIDLDLWNNAKWKATVFLYNKHSAPYLGLAFENREAAINIFRDWNSRFGHTDSYEEIRVAILQGEIPNQEYGYTVHINTNFENLVSKCVENGLTPEQTLVMTIGRFNRMNPSKLSRNLENFLEEYRRHLSYILIPVYFKSERELQPIFELGIEKTELILKEASEINENNIDYVCIK